MRNKVTCGDCLELMRELPDNYVDSIITDPPYEINFMSAKWDNTGIAFNVEVWAECLRVAKPGAFLLAFGGTRTWHRIACAIEDAGWTLRDTIAWHYGSGFPKSKSLRDVGEDWIGYGTALKPSHEDVIIAQKPFTYKEYCENIAYEIGASLCQLASSVSAAEKHSQSNQQELNEEQNSVVWSAVEKCNTLEDLYGLTDMLQSELEMPLSLNTGLSWLNILGEIYCQWNRYTTEIQTALIIDLKILNSLILQTTQDCTLQELMKKNGTTQNVCPVAQLFNAVKLKLAITRDVSAQENATSLGKSLDLRPEFNPIMVFMKPCDGTFAQNAEKWGIAGLNIDGGRIALPSGSWLAERGEAWCKSGNGAASNDLQSISGKERNGVYTDDKGRWPANTILSCACDGEHAEDCPVRIMDGQSNGASRFFYQVKKDAIDEEIPARFLYTAKPSRAEKEAGLEGFEFPERLRLKDDLTPEQVAFVTMELERRGLSL